MTEQAVYVGIDVAQATLAVAVRPAGVATRYAKQAASFLAHCQIRATALWAKVI